MLRPSYIRLESEKPQAPASSSSPSPKRRVLPGVLVIVAIIVLVSIFSTTDASEHAVSQAAQMLHAMPSALSVLEPRHEAVAAILTGTYYIPPMLVLAHTLKKHSPQRARILLLPSNSHFEDEHLSLLTRGGWQLRVVDHIPVTDGKRQKVPDQYRDVMNKLHIWNMTEYDAVGLIDGDAMVIDRIDEPFDILHMTSYPLVGVHDLSHPRAQDISTALEYSSGINAGAMFVKPNTSTFLSLIESSHHTDSYNVRLPEQNLISKVFSGQWLALGAGYNLMPFFRYDGRGAFYKKIRATAKILHFAAERKPWLWKTGTRDPSEDDYKLWIAALQEMLQETGISVAELEPLKWDISGLLRRIEKVGIPLAHKSPGRKPLR